MGVHASAANAAHWRASRVRPGEGSQPPNADVFAEATTSVTPPATVDAAEASGRARSLVSPARIGTADAIKGAITIALLLFVLLAAPSLLSASWITVFTAAAIYSIVALGLGILMGRVGLVSLGQIAVLSLGAWVAAKLLFDTSLPFPIVILLSGLITMVLGTIVGLPALRLSGLYLALITLMMAGAITVVLAATDFPNGGPGFLAHTESSLKGVASIRRPAIAETDPAYFRYTIVVAALMFLLALWHVRSKAGRAWEALRQSEPAALAAGVNMTLYKLWAFALASFMTGVAGALLAANAGQLFNYQFPTSQNITLLAVVLMGGIYNLWGAVIAGLLFRYLPELLDTWGLPPDLLTILFGVGVLQVLLTAPAGIVDQFPKDMARLGRLIGRTVRRS
jgi:branched-chain amino acid transport system permease protein